MEKGASFVMKTSVKEDRIIFHSFVYPSAANFVLHFQLDEDDPHSTLWLHLCIHYRLLNAGIKIDNKRQISNFSSQMRQWRLHNSVLLRLPKGDDEEPFWRTHGRCCCRWLTETCLLPKMSGKDSTLKKEGLLHILSIVILTGYCCWCVHWKLLHKLMQSLN